VGANVEVGLTEESGIFGKDGYVQRTAITLVTAQ
jgi:hypothetical protein